MRQRIDRLHERIARFKFDAFLISSLSHIRYVFGFTGSNALALVSSDKSFLITDRRYAQQADDEVRDAEVLIASLDLYTPLEQVLRGREALRLGFEATHLSVKDFRQLRKIFPDAELLAAEHVVEAMTLVKDEQEIADTRRAARIVCKVFEELSKLIKVGMKEAELSAEISYRAKRWGSERDPFEPIVASGLRSALPHGISTGKTLRDGELVIIDFGATVNGYTADFTRTVFLGTPTAKQTEMATVVREALVRAEAAAKPGIPGNQLDKVARDFLSQKGYGTYFQHSLGHGLGLDVHSLPRIGERSNDPIPCGCIITLEPGVYIADTGGVRIEDDFIMNENGVENLTPYSRELLCVQ